MRHRILERSSKVWQWGIAYLQSRKVKHKLVLIYLFLPFLFFKFLDVATWSLLKTNDYCAIPQQLKDQLTERYPGARRAYLKSGGDFPFLSRPDEVNLHLQVMILCLLFIQREIPFLLLQELRLYFWVFLLGILSVRPVFQLASAMWQLHLRRVGVEARPDLIRTIPKEGSGGSPSKKNDKRKDPDDSPKDNNGSSENPSTQSQLPPPPENSESHSLDDQPLSNAKIWNLANEGKIVLLASGFLNKQHILPAQILLQLTWEIFVHLQPLYVGLLYTILNYNWKFRQAV